MSRYLCPQLARSHSLFKEHKGKNQLMTAVEIIYIRRNYTFNMANHQNPATFPHPLDTSRFYLAPLNIAI